MNGFQMGWIGVASECSGRRLTLNDCVQAVVLVADVLVHEVLDGLSSLTSENGCPNSFACPFPVSEEVTAVLCGQAPSVTQTFVAQLEIRIRNGPQNLADSLATEFFDLQHPNIELIGDSIEFGIALQEVSRCVEDVLPTVDALVSGLAGWLRVQPLLNPVKPEVFVNAWLDCLARHVPDRNVRTSLLLPSAGLLGVSLRQLYRELFDWLLSRGVEPSLPVGESLGGERSAAATVMSNSVGRRIGILDKFRKLLSGEAETGLHSSGRQDFLPTVPYSYIALEDLNLIKPMMQRLVERGRQFSGDPVEGEGMPDKPNAEKDLNKELGEAVLPLMLDSLLQDRRLSPAVGDLIKKLEPALMRLARSDPRFFSERQHPARLLLTWLIRHGLLGGFQNQRQHDRFIARIALAIPILQTRDASAPLFASVLRRLDDERTLDSTSRHGAGDWKLRYC
jgi:hypothetical protein